MSKTGQNTSSAVMQQRREPPDAADDFPTPSWATRALIEKVMRPLAIPDMKNLVALEPACNRGYMARPLAEYCGGVLTSDIFDYGWDGQQQVADFLYPGFRPGGAVDLTFCNPPFRLAREFIMRAQEISRLGCAMLVRTSFLEGAERYRELFKPLPPTIIAQFAERVILTKGIVRDPAEKYWDEAAQKWRRPSTATSYCWLIWLKNQEPQPFVWIPPCRKSLERAGDYSQDIAR